MHADDLLLISVGGAAASVARRVIRQTEVRAVILDTDDAVLGETDPNAHGGAVKIFGAKRLAGRGTGGDYRLGASAFRDDGAAMLADIGTPRLALVLTCLGGGTAGATEYLLRALREQGTVTVTFAIQPFAFEGDDRKRNAKLLRPMIESATDAITAVNPAVLLDNADTLTADEAFARVADRLGDALSLFWTLLSHPSYFAFDAEHFHRMLSVSHDNTALPFDFAAARISGEDRAESLLNTLTTAPAFCRDGSDRLSRATRLVIGILSGSDLRLSELNTLITGLRIHCPSLKETFLGTSQEDRRNGELTAVLLAFGSNPGDEDEDIPSGTEAIRTGRRGHRTSPSRLASGNNRFGDVEPTLWHGENLDDPTYQRRGIRLSR